MHSTKELLEKHKKNKRIKRFSSLLEVPAPTVKIGDRQAVTEELQKALSVFDTMKDKEIAKQSEIDCFADAIAVYELYINQMLVIMDNGENAWNYSNAEIEELVESVSLLYRHFDSIVRKKLFQW